MPEAKATGRRRLSHSLSCKRQRDALVKRWQRLHEARAAWRAELGLGNYTRAVVRAQVRELNEEMAALERTLAGRVGA